MFDDKDERLEGVGAALRRAFDVPPEHLEDYVLLRKLDERNDNYLTGGVPSSDTL